jgi:integrating conjugative element protein (TIGR03757 family)
MKTVAEDIPFLMVCIRLMGSTTAVPIRESSAMPSCPHHVEERRCRPRRQSTIVLCALAATANVMATDVRVFTDRDHPVEAPAGVHVVELDATTRIGSALAAGLPSDPAQAAAIVQQRLKERGAALQRRLVDAYQGVADAWSLSVTKIPAVVVDQRYVVYGETDVARALARIEEYRRTEP